MACVVAVTDRERAGPTWPRLAAATGVGPMASKRSPSGRPSSSSMSLKATASAKGGMRSCSFASSLRSKIGFLISRPATELMRHHLDPNNHNGAVFLGLNGVVVKSHGSASAKGVANAIGVAAKLVEANITQRITDDLAFIRANGQ